MDTITLIGASGAFLILVAFVMNQMKKWKKRILWKMDAIEKIENLSKTMK